MISSTQFGILTARFKDYIQSLNVSDAFVKEHIDLKVEHTYRVMENSRIIAGSTGLSDEEVQMAEVIALTHDIGRFRQFIKYRTFDDSLSVNHAALGVSVVREIDFFSEIADDTERMLIETAIMNHNVSKLDPQLMGKDLLFTRLIRDADKVDIWYILTWKDVVFKILEPKQTDSEYAVPDEILTCFRKGQLVPAANSMNDYRLLRLSWIYDMNFPATFSLILKHDYVTKILAKIPPSREKDEIAGIIQNYIHLKARV